MNLPDIGIELAPGHHYFPKFLANRFAGYLRSVTPLSQRRGIFMANIRKRGDEWQVQVRRQGFPSRSRTFNRQQEAAACARAQELAMDRLEAGVYQPVTCTLASILSEYLAKVTPAKKSAASEMRRLNRLIRDPLASYRVCDLSPAVLATFRDRRLEQGLRAVECPSDIIDQIAGWSASSIGASDGKGYELPVLTEWMKMLED